jgi:bifunctional non-homologous end joining protein LigD
MLQNYKGRRDFKHTPEPPDEQETTGEGPLVFVVQKHAARQLHYDFRLEVGGSLKSWAVSKGPSSDPETKRLAVMVEDHPLAYAGFEGPIPKGQYGAGQVIVWDQGTYSPDENRELSFADRARAEERMKEGLSNGKISIRLRGEKLKGSWTLVRMRQSDKNWLLIKHEDRHAAADRNILEEENSVISGLTIDDLKSGKLPSGKEPVPATPAAATGAIKAAFPLKLSPMLASLANAPFSDERWFFEPKLDGFRTLAFINNDKVSLRSRRGLNVTEHYATLTEDLEHQPASQLILDGEIIALDARGKLCFQCLEDLNSTKRTRNNRVEPPSDIIYYVFDILYLDGYDLRGVALKQRKKFLHSVLETGRSVRLVEHFAVDGQAVYQAAIENGLEGLIAKRQDSLYETGKRSNNWLKIKKVNSEDFVVGGFTRGTGNRAKTIGALMLGYYDNKKDLKYAGKAGSGFDDDTLFKLKKQLDEMSVKNSPFSHEPEQTAGVTWVKPELVVEVKFAEWTRDGRLRAPVFLRVRKDKSAASVQPSRVIETGDRSQKRTSNGQAETVNDVLTQLAGGKNNVVIEVEGQKVSLSNLDKELWPETGKSRAITKRDLITYLAQVSPYLLPHLQDRPLTLSRYPDGIYGEHFFQKHYQPRPEFVETVLLSSHDTSAREYLICNNLATLLWLGQIADVELHAWFSRVRPGPDFKANAGPQEVNFYVRYPDFIIFDIDPYIYSGKEAPGAEPELNRAAFSETCQVALKVKETLDGLSLPSFVKTSGRTGLHVFVPVLRQLDFHGTRAAAETLSRFLSEQHPEEITIEWAVEKRGGKVFLDYNQNVQGKTLASVYSPRPSVEASVSVPLRWDELDKVYPTDFTILTTPGRLADIGDLWGNLLEVKADLVNMLGWIGPDGQKKNKPGT